MASQGTLDKAKALREKINTNQAKLDSLTGLANPTADQRREIRILKNQISDAQYQFRTDKDLLSLAGENMSAGDKLAVFGLGSGTVGGLGTSAAASQLIQIAGATKALEEATGTGTNKPQSEEALAEEPAALPPPTEVFEPIENVLHQYATYTYGLSLHLLTVDEYNLVVQEERYIPKRVLVASAGRYNTLGEGDPNRFLRNSYFSRDYFFDNLEMNTIIGPTENNRMTNAVSIEFTLVEPYGVTFLDNLIAACGDPEIGSLNYLDMPYLLEIDFFANTDTGEIVNKVPGITKRIPIQILKMDVRVTGKGSEYKFKATPYNHGAYNATAVQVPVITNVVAGTVAEFFQSKESTGVPTELENEERDTARSTLYRTPNGQFALNGQTVNRNTVPLALLSKSSLNRIRTVNSLGDALNEWYRQLRDENKIGANDEYFFEFDPEIGDSQFTSITNSTTDPKHSRMASIDNTGSIRLASATQRGSGDFDKTTKVWEINPGTTIEKIINTMVKASDYVQRQIILPEDYTKPEDYKKALEKSKADPLNWFKIVPSMRLGEFDPVRKIYKRYITFHIKTYKIYNIKIELGPQGIALYPVKLYNYLYTGKNQDILDLNITFNALYFNAITAYKQKMTDVSNVPAKANEEYDIKNPSSYIGTPQDPNSVMPMVMKPIVLNARNNASGMELTARDVASGDLEHSILTMSGADMLNVSLTIVGDPDFIKQDDVFYKPKHYGSSATDSEDSRLTPNGSLKTDNGDLHVQLTIRTPIDIDEPTGLMVFDEQYQQSVFSGLYKVISVTSTFNNGNFTQVLKLVRLPRQPFYDYQNQTKNDITERTGDDTSKAMITNDKDNNNITDGGGGGGTAGDANSDPGDGQQSAQDSQANNKVTTDEEPVSQDQKNLIKNSKNMDTQNISGSTEPQASANNPNAGQIEKLKSDLTSVNIEIGVYGGGVESSQSVAFNQSSADSFARSIDRQQTRIQDAVTTYGADAPIVADLQKDLQFYRKQQASFTAKAEEARVKLAEAEAKKSQIQDRIDALR